MTMAMAIHLSCLSFPSPPLISTSKPSSGLRSLKPISASPISNAQTRERQRMKDLFKEARERCINDPMEGVSFTLEEFQTAIDENAFGTDVGSKVKGTVFMTNDDGAFVDIAEKSSAFLPLNEACIYKIQHVSEAGVYPGLQEEFVVIGENTTDDSLILSLRLVQYDLAWERCQQLHAENAVVKGKVTGGNKGGVLVTVEGIQGFIPSSEISKKSAAGELLGKELPLKFLNVDKKQSQLILSNRKAMVDSRVHIEIASVVKGTVCSLKSYGALIDVGGLTGLLHVSEISHERITDIATVLQPGDTLKVMVLGHDQERERLSLSTKKLEPTPGDMIHNPKLVFEKADEMAEDFKQRIAWVEEMACTGLLMSQSEV